MNFERARAALSGSRFGDLRSVAETGSTNADMRAILAAPLSRDTGPAPVVLLADHQSAGRGRLDREWQAPAGSSILMSIGCTVERVRPERRTLLTMCLSLAVTDATSSVGLENVSIKWPNDIVVADEDYPSASQLSPFGYRKLGGVLAELVNSWDQGVCAILGLGLNVNWNTMPEDLARTALSLDAIAGAEVDRDDLVVAIVSSFDDRLAALEDPSTNIEKMIELYSSRCSTLGREVAVELVNEVVTGVAARVAADGALEVATDSGSRRITAGDVVHLRPRA